jgi:hypothetical protein
MVQALEVRQVRFLNLVFQNKRLPYYSNLLQTSFFILIVELGLEATVSYVVWESCLGDAVVRDFEKVDLDVD